MWLRGSFRHPFISCPAPLPVFCIPLFCFPSATLCRTSTSEERKGNGGGGSSCWNVCCVVVVVSGTVGTAAQACQVKKKKKGRSDMEVSLAEKPGSQWVVWMPPSSAAIFCFFFCCTRHILGACLEGSEEEHEVKSSDHPLSFCLRIRLFTKYLQHLAYWHL